MPAKLTTTVSKIAQVPNKTNFAIIEEFYAYMRAKGSSEQHQNNALKTVIAYANFLGSETTFREVQQKTAAVTIILAIDTAELSLWFYYYCCYLSFLSLLSSISLFGFINDSVYDIALNNFTVSYSQKATFPNVHTTIQEGKK